MKKSQENDFLVRRKESCHRNFANGLGPDSLFRGWRKPSPNVKCTNMLDLDLDNSFLIGDRLSDVEAGFNAGIKNLIHLETGHGIKERSLFSNLKKKKLI